MWASFNDVKRRIPADGVFHVAGFQHHYTKVLTVTAGTRYYRFRQYGKRRGRRQLRVLRGGPRTLPGVPPPNIDAENLHTNL